MCWTKLSCLLLVVAQKSSRSMMSFSVEVRPSRFRFRGQHRTIAGMTLKQSNPYLKSAAARKAGLRVSAQTSSAVEGIRAPFAKGAETRLPASTEAFIAYWKRRVAANAR
jgi:hypothetical protein